MGACNAKNPKPKKPNQNNTTNNSNNNNDRGEPSFSSMKANKDKENINNHYNEGNNDKTKQGEREQKPSNNGQKEGISDMDGRNSHSPQNPNTLKDDSNTHIIDPNDIKINNNNNNANALGHANNEIRLSDRIEQDVLGLENSSNNNNRVQQKNALTMTFAKIPSNSGGVGVGGVSGNDVSGISSVSVSGVVGGGGGGVSEDVPVIMQCCYLFGYEKQQSIIVRFDPLNQSFKSIDTPSNMQIYNFCSVTYINDNMIIVAGGLRDEIEAVSNQVYLYNPNMNTAQQLTSFKTKRFAHQATYSNNNLYIIGGLSETHQNLLSCERYNFIDKQWYQLPDLNIGRAFGILLIYDKDIYILGGTSNIIKDNERKMIGGNDFEEPGENNEVSKTQYLRKIEKLDRGLSKWTVLDLKLPMGIDNVYACSLDHDEVQLIGGQAEFLSLSSNMVFNLRTGCYTLKKFMNNQRVAHKGMVHQTKIWIFGGDMDDTIEQYDVARDEWHHKGSPYQGLINEIQAYGYSIPPLLVKARHGGVGGGGVGGGGDAVHDQHLVGSGDNASERNGSQSESECFLFGDDYTSFILKINFTKRLVKECPIPYDLRLLGYQGVCRLKDGRYFFNGGMDSTNSYISNRTFLYHPDQNKAIKTTKSLYNRYTFNLIPKDNYVYAIGGRAWGDDDTAIMKVCERYNLSSHIWEKIADLNQKRCSSMALIHQDRIYVAGGYGGSQERCTSIERYSDSKNIWEIINVELSMLINLELNTSMVSSGLEGSCVLYTDQPGQYLFVGGRSDVYDSDKVWIFDLQKGETTEIGTLRDRKSLHKVHNLNNGCICVFGGESELVQFFNIKEGNVYEDEFGAEIDKIITKQFFITGRERNVRLIRQSIA